MLMHRRTFLHAMLAGGAASALPGWARAQEPAVLPPGMLQALDAARIPLASTSVVLQRVDAGAPNLAWLSRAERSPASVLKLVTTDAALNLLGPAFRWKTPFYAAGPVRHGVLEGDLAIVGSGDPHLMSEDLWHVALRLRGLGLRRILGDVRIDRSLFDLPPHDPGAFDGDALAAYNAGPDAFLLNFGVMRLNFQPDPLHSGVSVWVDPPMAGFRPERLPRLSTGACGAWQARLRAQGIDTPLTPAFAGHYSAECDEQTWNIGAPMPRNAYARALLRAVFDQVGIAWHGDVVSGTLPPGATLLTTWESEPLAVILRDINKYSNNVMAQQVFLTLGLQAGGAPATFAKAQQMVANWLAGNGLAMPGLVMDNGCGLSRIARISALNINDLLQAAWRSPLMPEFLATLPLAGEDGTLRRRFADRPEAGLVHAKTGTLDDVLALAGYVQSPTTGARSTLVVIINDPRASAGWPAVEALIDHALRQT